MEVAADGDGLSLSKRRITLSTSGVVPKIARWGEEAGTMLAISLHATNDELRDELVPINKKYPIAELLDACRNYPGLSNARRITFEYVMLKGVNDSLADARALVRLLAGIPAKINLIPFNPWPGTPLRVLGLGADRALRRGRQQGRLREPGAHAARPRHPRRLRPAQIGEREAARAAQRARPGDAGASERRGRAHVIWTTTWPHLIVVPFALILAAMAAGFVLVTLGLERITQFLHVNPIGDEDAETVFDVMDRGFVLAGEHHAPAGAADGHHRRDRTHPRAALLRGRRRHGAGGHPAARALRPGGAIASPEALVWQVFATAGFAGGFVYWLIAGRNA